MTEFAVERDLGILSVGATSDELGVSRSTVYVLIEEGELTRIRIGKRAFVTRESINRLLQRAFAEADAKQAAKERAAAKVEPVAVPRD